jgi:nitroreductase
MMARMDVKAEWYDQIPRRISRRRYDGRPVAGELREQLGEFCAGASAAVEAEQVRVLLVDDPRRQLFTGLVGGYGKVAGTSLAAAFVGRAAGGGVPDVVQDAAGYLGEAFILEATRLGLGTCWIAASFDKAAAGLLGLEDDERVVAVTPVGYPTEQQPGGERLLRTLVKASARHSVEKLAPGILDGGWPDWAVSAVQAARLAPSGARDCRSGAGVSLAGSSVHV